MSAWVIIVLFLVIFVWSFSRCVAVSCVCGSSSGWCCISVLVFWRPWNGRRLGFWCPVILWLVPFRWWGWSSKSWRVAVCCIAYLGLSSSCSSLVKVILMKLTVRGKKAFCDPIVGCLVFCWGFRSMLPFQVVSCCRWFLGWLSSSWAIRLCIPGAWCRAVCLV